MESKNIRPAWAEINLDNLKHNIRETRKLIKKNTLLTAVVKANGYGHDSVEVSKLFLKNGADRLAVATLSEAIELRIGGIKDTPIMILGYTPDSQREELFKYNIISTIYSFSQAELLSKTALSKNEAFKVHIKIDTGMGRLGFKDEEESVKQILKISSLPNLEIEGIFTHFARADEKNKDFTRLQFDRFIKMVNILEENNVNIPIKHVSNSAAIIDLPEYNLDMVRAGVMLYGLYPSKDIDKKNINLKSAMSLKTKLSYIKTIGENEGVSYGHTYITDKETKIGTIPIGYADGFNRSLSNNIKLSIKEKKVNLVGTICMDQSMVDLSDVENVNIGDVVTIFADGKKNTNTIDDIARKLGTINYEVVCMVGNRVPRLFIEGDKIIKIKDYNLHMSI